MTLEKHKGKLIVITAPSGAGKTTIVRHLLSEIEELAFSVSATSRKPRHYEKEGRDYYFLSAEDFRRKADNKEFLEWEEVYHNQFYGTLKSEVQRLWDSGKHIIFDIDVKGAVNIKSAYPEQTMTLFIKPPSKEVLFERLRKRNTEDEASLQKRFRRAEDELAYEERFDDSLINDDLDTALQEAENKVRQFLELSVNPEWKQK
ncbi:MAG: guanylate kinase [Bacteroidetes bacterium]|nr:guanylate kinase [Bacteroidota bacterium]